MSSLFDVLADQEQRVIEKAVSLLDTLESIKQLRGQTMNELRYRKISNETYAYRMKQYDRVEGNIQELRNELMTEKSVVRLLRGAIRHEIAAKAN